MSITGARTVYIAASVSGKVEGETRESRRCWRGIGRWCKANDGMLVIFEHLLFLLFLLLFLP